MPATSQGAPPQRILPKPDVLRQNITDRINVLSDEELIVLNDVILDIEMRSAWADFTEGASSDWDEGKYDRLDETIQNVRAARRELPAP